jgi:hypothetical protein
VGIQQRLVVAVEKLKHLRIPAVHRHIRQQLSECLHLIFVVIRLRLQNVQANDLRVEGAQWWSLSTLGLSQGLHFSLSISSNTFVCGEVHDRWIYLFQVRDFCRNFWERKTQINCICERFQQIFYYILEGRKLFELAITSPSPNKQLKYSKIRFQSNTKETRDFKPFPSHRFRRQNLRESSLFAMA